MVQERETLLIVEDSAIQAEMLRRALVEAGYTVFVGRDGVEGLALARLRKPALIISDIVMPRMDGHQLCREIKQDATLRFTPVVLLTDLSDPSEIINGL